MNLFDQWVNEALKQQTDLAPLRIVVEKELLHRDILRVLSKTGLLTKLTFIGGTCLRTCYGSHRLSEDLDFTGGHDFNRALLEKMAQHIVKEIHEKYDLTVKVSEPTRDEGRVDTWKITVQTRPDRKDLPAQRINIDVCALTSHEPRPMMLKNPYGIDMGTNGLIIQAESREEIFADKIIAFALRPNRIKHRDLWDIAWLHQQNILPLFSLIPAKLKEHGCSQKKFRTLLEERSTALSEDQKLASEFRKEMQRFLPAHLSKTTTETPEFWTYLTHLMQEIMEKTRKATT